MPVGLPAKVWPPPSDPETPPKQHKGRTRTLTDEERAARKQASQEKLQKFLRDKKVKRTGDGGSGDFDDKDL